MSKKNRTKPSIRPKGFPTGTDLLHDPLLNKGTAFTASEREQLGLRGLLPPHIHSQAEQVARFMYHFRKKPTALEKYMDIIDLQDRNETLFYRVLIDHLEEMMPIIYTPTVGQACEEYGHIFRRSRGLFISAADRGHISEILQNWPNKDVRIIVVTDGERILGLGDLGADGMGIPVGKLSLYTACAGVHMSQCLPITLDVGTENQTLLADPLYIGLKQRRIQGKAYDELIEEFIRAVQQVFPRALVQFEDFATENAFALLKRYRQQICCFDDDIQGTAAVALAGLYAAMQLIGTDLKDQKLLFLGSGQASVGIADLVVSALEEEGLSKAEARAKCWLVDSKGLVVKGRAHLAPHKQPYGHQEEPIDDLLTAIHTFRPTVLIGACGQPGKFDRPVLEAMARLNERPVVFALSNPTSKAECTAKEAYEFTQGRAIFASGSPFYAVTIGTKEYLPSQGNNAYIFPGLGLGATACDAQRISDEMVLAAAKALALQVTPHDLGLGRIYPPIGRIREVSAHIAAAVAAAAYQQGLAQRARPEDLFAFISNLIYQPEYQNYC